MCTNNIPTWVCKDGRELVICDMELSHIDNAIALLRNKGAVTEQEFNTHLMLDNNKDKTS